MKIGGRARLVRLAVACLGLLAVLATPAYAAGTGDGVGRVVFRIGGVHLVTDGAENAVQRGDRVYEGDRVETGADGHVQIRFADGGFVALRPSSAATINVYRHDGRSAKEIRIKLELERGTLRNVTGEAGERNRSGYRLNTPIAAIGVRGTDYTVRTSAARTRVEVHDGGVTVAPFGADCRRSGFGACSGERARSLFAREADGRLIEVTRSGGAARIIETNGDGDADNAAADNAASDSASSNTEALDEQRTTRDTLDETPADDEETPADDEETPAGDDETPAGDEETPAGDDPEGEEPVAAPQPGDPPDRFADLRDDITWGRWSRFAKAGDDATQRRDDQRVAATNRVFGLFVPEWSRWPDNGLPDSGTVSFVPGDAEAVVLNGDSVQAASVHNPELTIDFSAETFRTAFDLRSETLDTDAAFHAQGAVERDGGLRSDGRASNAVVRGVVAPGAEQAGMLFQGDLPDDRTAAGAIDWFR